MSLRLIFTLLTHLLRKPDIFEVNLSVISKNGIILLPEEVHDCKSGLALEIPELVVHLRNHDYYMGEFSIARPIYQTHED